MKRLLTVGLLTMVSLYAAPKAEAIDLNLTMTNTGLNNALGGVYIGPYTVQVGMDPSNTFQVICDDFQSDTYVGESWTAAVSTFASLSDSNPTASPARFDGTSGSIQKYDEVAWLATQMLNPTLNICSGSVNCIGDIQYALWQVFAPTDVALNYLGAPGSGNTSSSLGNRDTAQAWLNAAIAAVTATTFDASQYLNVVILTPTSCQGCGKLPQEFIAVRSVPEPAGLLLLATGMIGAFLYRRRQAGQSQAAF